MLSVSVALRSAKAVTVKGAGAEDDSWQRVVLATGNNIRGAVALWRRAILHTFNTYGIYMCR